MRLDALELDDGGRRRHRRDDFLDSSIRSRRSRIAAPRRARGCTSTPLMQVPRWFCPELRWAFEGRRPRRLLVVNAHKWMFTHGLLADLDEPADEFRDAFSLVPSTCGRRTRPAFNISEYGPAWSPLPQPRLWAVLCAATARKAAPRIREAIRLAELFEGWVLARAGWEPCAAAVLRREASRRGPRGERGDPRARERERRDLHLAHEAERPLRPPACGRERAHDGGGRPPGVDVHVTFGKSTITPA